MIPTVADIEAEVVSRAGGLLTLVGLSILADGTNPDLLRPITLAARMVGIATAGVTLVDLDIPDLTATAYGNLCDAAEWRTLLNVQGDFNRVTQRVGGNEIDYSDLLRDLNLRIARLEARLKTALGLGAAVPVARPIGIPDARPACDESGCVEWCA